MYHEGSLSLRGEMTRDEIRSIHSERRRVIDDHETNRKAMFPIARWLDVVEQTILSDLPEGFDPRDIDPSEVPQRIQAALEAIADEPRIIHSLTGHYSRYPISHY